MIQVRKAQERGQTKIDWLESYHAFSFGDYYDPEFTAFRSLRVINEDWIRPNSGFDSHSHRDMEIITYILQGSLQHRDSLGNGSVIRPGEIQRMSAGTGITHSEFNASSTEAVHLLQIWILPDKKGLQPSYEQKSLPAESLLNAWQVIASHQKNPGVNIHQNVDLFAAKLEAKKSLAAPAKKIPYGWLQVARGSVRLNDTLLTSGDAAAVTNEPSMTFTAVENCELLFFRLD